VGRDECGKFDGSRQKRVVVYALWCMFPGRDTFWLPSPHATYNCTHASSASFVLHRVFSLHPPLPPRLPASLLPFFLSLQLSIDCLPPSCSQLSFARSVSLAFALLVLSLTRQVFVGRIIDDTGKDKGKMKATRDCGGSASGGDESGCNSTCGGQEEGLEDECVARRALLYWHEMRSLSQELH